MLCLHQLLRLRDGRLLLRTLSRCAACKAVSIAVTVVVAVAVCAAAGDDVAVLG